MKINIHAGHNPDSKIACGAVGYIKESTEARKVKDKLIELLKAEGHTVYDCTCNDGSSQSNVLSKIVAKCNAHDVDLDVSIHFNSGASEKKANGKTTGTEVLVQSYTSKATDTATRICQKIYGLGFKNRGVKIRSNLYVLNKTKAPALLVECCFVDDVDDTELYDADKMAKAIAEGILNKTLGTSASTSKVTSTLTKSVKASQGAELKSSSIAGKYKVSTDLNMRHGAGTSYDIMVTIPKGTKVTCYGWFSKAKDGKKWYYVQATISKVTYTGFVSSSYLKKV